jgi:hypothetical protein
MRAEDPAVIDKNGERRPAARKHWLPRLPTLIRVAYDLTRSQDERRCAN